jgi:hypothetical protein
VGNTCGRQGYRGSSQGLPAMHCVSTHRYGKRLQTGSSLYKIRHSTLIHNSGYHSHQMLT